MKIGASQTDGTIAAGWAHLRTQTASASSSIDFVNGVSGAVINSTYDMYAVVLTNVTPTTDGDALYARMGTSGGFSSTANYSSYRRDLVNGTSGDVSSTGAAQWALTPSGAGTGIGNDTGEGLSGVFYFWNPELLTTKFLKAQWTMLFDETDAGFVGVWGIGRNSTTGAACDRIQFLPSTGASSIAGGTFSLFGIRNS